MHVNGYDSNINEMFVAHSGAALRRGYNVLLFDGPGQGRNLIRDGLPMRPDWENVVRPVLDYALERSEVDADRIVLAGWSWGGSWPRAPPPSRIESLRCGRTPGNGISAISYRLRITRKRASPTASTPTGSHRWRTTSDRRQVTRSCAGVCCNAASGSTG